ncbi:VOC family protein [Paenibacillus nasutitermitis]|uniref:VOC family protein n=1 Tax=Paenibacillus nasutitermitis TaxID=1652958 RepID=UPI001665CC66
MSHTEQSFQLPWNGIHHIALNTADLDATIRFYRDVLGMHTSVIGPSQEGRGRHCLIFFKPKDGNECGFHFFERPIEKNNARRFRHSPTEFRPSCCPAAPR